MLTKTALTLFHLTNNMFKASTVLLFTLLSTAAIGQNQYHFSLANYYLPGMEGRPWNGTSMKLDVVLKDKIQFELSDLILGNERDLFGLSFNGITRVRVGMKYHLKPQHWLGVGYSKLYNVNSDILPHPSMRCATLSDQFLAYSDNNSELLVNVGLSIFEINVYDFVPYGVIATSTITAKRYFGKHWLYGEIGLIGLKAQFTSVGAAINL